MEVDQQETGSDHGEENNLEELEDEGSEEEVEEGEETRKRKLSDDEEEEEEEDQEELEDATYQGEETSNPSQPSIDKDLLKSIKWPSDVSKTNLRSFMASMRQQLLRLGMFNKAEIRDLCHAKWEELSQNTAPVVTPQLDRSSRTRRKPTTYRIPDENDIYGDEPEKRGRGRRSAPVEVAKPKKGSKGRGGKAKMKKTLTVQERKDLKAEKAAKAALGIKDDPVTKVKISKSNTPSPAPIRIKISLKGNKGKDPADHTSRPLSLTSSLTQLWKNGSGHTSRSQSDNESESSEHPSLPSKTESEISDAASDTEKSHVGEMCEICQLGGDLLLCSACDRAFHRDCVNLDSVPEGDWFCSKCDEDASSAEEEEEDDEHVDFCKRCKDGGELLCCESCTSAYHLHCINPPLEDVPNGKWQCERCGVPPLTGKVQSIITWRWHQVDNKEEKSKKKRTREFLVKFLNLSYWRCEWVSEVQMEVFHMSKMRNFLRKNDCETPPAIEEVEDAGEFNDPNVKIMIAAGVPVNWFRVYRVLRIRNIKNSPTLYLVKWRDLSYEYCTWEPEGEVLLGLDEALDEYKRFKKLNDKKHRCIKTGKSNAKVVGDPTEKFEKQPSYIDSTGGKLHPYQLEGLNWLRHCWSQDRNTILADEMGLGKTIQTISFINSLATEGHCTKPFLISVPLSTLVNWEREFEFWAPDLYVVTYIGPKENRAVIREHEFSYGEDAFHRFGTKASRVRKGCHYKFDVLLTSYELVNVDATCLGSVEWSVLVVDEAHRLKNNRSLFFRTLTAYPIDYRLLLTGTPLQNNLEELFHLLNFMEKKTFDSLENFQEQFDNVGKEEQVQKLHDLLSPHLLRRLKQDVLTDIPAKNECLVRVELSKIQKKYYKHILTRNYEALSAKGYGHTSLINIMMELKKCSNHAYLVAAASQDAARNRYGGYERAGLTAGSGKLMLLRKMLRKLKDTGHRVLIFSQMRIMLDLLEDFLDYEGYKYERIDGAITGSDRQEAIDRFNKPTSQSFVFLLSTRAGGLGINLATADTVFIYDSDWNPHNDIQALSRAHRIGQFNKVMIYRFVTRNSIEEKITQVAKHKMMLTHLVVRPGMGAACLSKSELDSILKFGSKDLFGEEEEKTVKKDKDGNDVEDDVIDYPEEMVDQLLDRDVVGEGEGSKEQLLDDYFSSFKIATYAKKTEEIEEVVPEEPEKEIITDQQEYSADDPAYWEKLLRHHYEQHQESEHSKMGKGKRVRKAVNYYTEGLESLSTNKKDEEEFDDQDDDDFEDEDGETGSKKRRKLGERNNNIMRPSDASLPPLLARVAGQLEVLGFNARQRRSFLNAVMRYGMPLSDAYHTNWRPRDLKNKTEKEFNAYVSLFMRHLCEPDNGNSHYFADGVPKEGLPRQQVLARIGVMGLIRRKVGEYAHINGELPSRPGSPSQYDLANALANTLAAAGALVTPGITPSQTPPEQVAPTPEISAPIADPSEASPEDTPTPAETTPAVTPEEAKVDEMEGDEKKEAEAEEEIEKTTEPMEVEEDKKEEEEKVEEEKEKIIEEKEDKGDAVMDEDKEAVVANGTEKEEKENDVPATVQEQDEEVKEEKEVEKEVSDEGMKEEKKEEIKEEQTEGEEKYDQESVEPKKKRFIFNICDRGFTELHNIWREEHFSGNTSIWSRVHDYWLLVGVISHGYGRWQDIINDVRFNTLNEPFGGDRRLEISGELVDKIKFMSRRFKLLEQALVAEAQVNRAVELGIQQNPNHPVMSLNASKSSTTSSPRKASPKPSKPESTIHHRSLVEARSLSEARTLRSITEGQSALLSVTDAESTLRALTEAQSSQRNRSEAETALRILSEAQGTLRTLSETAESTSTAAAQGTSSSLIQQQLLLHHYQQLTALQHPMSQPLFHPLLAQLQKNPKVAAQLAQQQQLLQLIQTNPNMASHLAALFKK